ncbi:MAG: hypothetical protein ABI837_07675 [Acidobacteriota bacterium]
MAERKAAKSGKGLVKKAAVAPALSRAARAKPAAAAAAPKAASKDAARSPRKTERMNVWLMPEQVQWLKAKKNASETMRALVTEAMSMDALVRSVKGGRKK